MGANASGFKDWTPNMNNALAFLLLAAPLFAAEKPINLHPANHRYYEFRGKPTVLITSAEHYGAVLTSISNTESTLTPFPDIEPDPHLHRRLP